VTLVDAGPLVALIDADEPDHQVCVEALDQLSLPLVTTWPAFTEAMCLLVRAGGDEGRCALWSLVTTSRLVVEDLVPDAVARSEHLMEQYRDRPMDLADATLVALAEQQHHRRIFSLDGDFHIYRMRGNRRFTVVPST
jgi:uncharacterized protein